MTTYYVGPGGSDAANGLSWANRKLTLNGVEDIPVAAGDTIYVGPGTYREVLAVDVSGSSGSPITYIADVTGEHTDGVGGVVRITGSDNDIAASRSGAVVASSKNYRTFTGFVIDSFPAGIVPLQLTDCTNWIIQDCSFGDLTSHAIQVNGASQANVTIRRCVFFVAANSYGVLFVHSSTVSNANHLVENCVLLGGSGVVTQRVGGVTVKNSAALFSASRGFRVENALAAGQTMTVNNCVIYQANLALAATAVGELVEDYNRLWACATPRTNVSTGANSDTSLVLLALPLLSSGFRFPYIFGALAPYSTLIGKAGSSEASDDLFGQARPVTSSKKSWGPVQYAPTQRETTTKRTGTASLKMADAGRHQIFVPISNASTVFSVYVQWQTDYAGTKPQMVIKQPGQSDTTVTATGSSGSWGQLTTTLTPAATPGFVVVELVSNNTATSGSYATYFDDLTTTGLAAATNFDAEWLTDTQRMNAYMQTPAGSSAVAAGTPFKGPFG